MREAGVVGRRAVLGLAALGGLGLVSGDARRSPGVAVAARPVPGEPGVVWVSHDGFVAHAEPCLAVNPHNPRNLLGACIAYTDDVSVIAAYASFDAGASWGSLGALTDSTNGRDPTVTFDAAGRGYVCANTDDLHVWRTDDGGRRFAAPVLATRELRLDHPWLAADPTPGPPSATHLFAVWTGPDNTELVFARSTNAGRRFEAPRVLDSAQGPNEANLASPMLAAGPGGTVHAIYGVWPSLPPTLPRPEFPAPIRVISSPDWGQTWGEPIELGGGVMEIRVTADTNGLGLPSVAAHRRRDLAAAAFVVRQPGAPFTDIAVCLSRDRGRSWTAPRFVPRATGQTSYLQPQLSIDENGLIALSAFAYRHGLIDIVVFVAAPEVVGNRPPAFGAPIRATRQPFNPAHGTLAGKHGLWWIGDYQGLASAGGMIHPFWNDPRTGQLEIFTVSLPAR